MAAKGNVNGFGEDFLTNTYVMRCLLNWTAAIAPILSAIKPNFLIWVRSTANTPQPKRHR
jgi:hypothetical protein